jgi:hypothetical protein
MLLVGFLPPFFCSSFPDIVWRSTTHSQPHTGPQRCDSPTFCASRCGSRNVSDLQPRKSWTDCGGRAVASSAAGDAGGRATFAAVPMYAWDELVPQAELTINLLRASNTNPSISAWEQGSHLLCSSCPRTHSSSDSSSEPQSSTMACISATFEQSHPNKSNRPHQGNAVSYSQRNGQFISNRTNNQCCHA